MNESEVAELKKAFEKASLPFTEQAALEKYTSFRIGGPADFLVQPGDEKQLVALRKIIHEFNLPVFLLGGGSNLLVADKGIRGICLHINFNNEPEILLQTDEYLQVRVAASAKAPATGRKISALGYEGLEFMTTIPGQMGGAVIQNAGCYGWELKDITDSVRILDENGLHDIAAADCEFTYRDSRFKHDPSVWVVSVTMTLKKAEPEIINARISDYRQRRLSSQPKNRRSAGSIFKNPPAAETEMKAWRLIDKAGLRGLRRGKALISEEHCNFIVNEGGATAADVLYLIEKAESEVEKQTGIKLQREVVLAGDFN